MQIDSYMEALYGKDAEETVQLRYCRDNVLNKTPRGREIIRQYYKWSPALVNVMEGNAEVKDMLKIMIEQFRDSGIEELK